MRRILSGHGASRGGALGRARVRLPHALEVVEDRIEPELVEAEVARMHDAVDAVRADMHLLRDRLHGALAHEVGEFLDLHALLLDDPELLAGLDDLIRTGRYTADYALRLQRDRIAAVFSGMDDDYLRSRIDDIDQVIGRLHAALVAGNSDCRGVHEPRSFGNCCERELVPLRTRERLHPALGLHLVVLNEPRAPAGDSM